MSEVFIDVWRQAERFERRSQVSTWLLAIARNKALSMLRRRSNEQLDEEVAEFIEDPSDNPEVMMQKQERASVLRDCLTQLSPAHREIIDLVYYHEKSIEEVAEIIARAGQHGEDPHVLRPQADRRADGRPGHRAGARDLSFSPRSAALFRRLRIR